MYKLQSPKGTVLTLMSRPGLIETADDGTGCCGDNSKLDGADILFRGSGITDAEGMGNTIENSYVCTDDGLCNFFPNPGAGLGTDFSDFIGEDPSGTWTLYIGDSEILDSGMLESWTLSICYNTGPALIPTLSEWGMIVFFIFMFGSASWVIKKRQQELL